MSFLPNGYEKPSTNSNYMKFEQGNNKFRIMSDAIVGWIDWDKSGEKPVPVRTKEKQDALSSQNKVKHFWSFVALDYKDNRIKILEITQSGIQENIFALHNDEAWGDPKGYDITVNRTGKDLETKYSVVPQPPTEVSTEAKALYESMDIDLEKLFDNGDPFENTPAVGIENEQPIDTPVEDIKF